MTDRLSQPEAASGSPQERLRRERRLQVAAALMLGLAVLLVILLRAGVANVFPAGWWRSL